MKERIVIIESGGDWTYASYTDLVVPQEMDLKAEHNLWRKWYEEVYVPELIAEKKPQYIDFKEFLISKGARTANLEVFTDF